MAVLTWQAGATIPSLGAGAAVPVCPAPSTGKACVNQKTFRDRSPKDGVADNGPVKWASDGFRDFPGCTSPRNNCRPDYRLWTDNGTQLAQIYPTARIGHFGDVGIHVLFGARPGQSYVARVGASISDIANGFKGRITIAAQDSKGDQIGDECNTPITEPSAEPQMFVLRCDLPSSTRVTRLSMKVRAHADSPALNQGGSGSGTLEVGSVYLRRTR